MIGPIFLGPRDARMTTKILHCGAAGATFMGPTTGASLISFDRQTGAMAMNHADVIKAVADKTGIDPVSCEKVVKALQKQAGSVLADRVRGNQAGLAAAVAGIAAQTGVSPGDCAKILTAVESVLKSTISDKLGFFKNMFAKR
jgi:hypothetical protein